MAKRRKNRTKKYILSVVGALAILFLIYVVYVAIRQLIVPSTGLSPDGAEEPEMDGPYAVVSVIDGDTIDVDIDGTVTRVRLIGIDTPELETEKGAEVAAAYTQALLEGHEVYLEYDEERLDNYGRTLSYVYLSKKRAMVNELLLQNGYARTLTIKPNVKYRERLAAAEAAAKADGVGLWGD